MSTAVPATLVVALPKRSRPLEAAREAIARCELCPRLRTYCRGIARAKKAAHRADDYWGRPVPGFGDPEARVLVVGLAPAAHGANRTGRVFTGDGSGDFLMRAMHDNGFASLPTARHAGDGLTLDDVYILSVARCAPPDNKPSPEEIGRCRVHLRAELAALPRISVVVALGKIAWDGYLAFLREEGGPAAIPAPSSAAGRPPLPRLRPLPRPMFGHGAVATFERGPTLLGSYHPSRQNTNTGRLTPPMLSAVFAEARRRLT
jgi:uracil-DNA glycosylase